MTDLLINVLLNKMEIFKLVLGCLGIFLVFILLMLIPYLQSTSDEKKKINSYFDNGGRLLDGDP